MAEKKIGTWQEVYKALVDAEEFGGVNGVADMAEVSRATLYAVLNGVYPHPHQPRFGPGVLLLRNLRTLPDITERIDKRRINPERQFVPWPYPGPKTALVQIDEG